MKAGDASGAHDRTVVDGATLHFTENVTDITEDTVRDVALPTGLVDTKVCAIDDTWSGLRLQWRKQLRDSGSAAAASGPPARGQGPRRRRPPPR